MCNSTLPTPEVIQPPDLLAWISLRLNDAHVAGEGSDRSQVNSRYLQLVESSEEVPVPVYVFRLTAPDGVAPRRGVTDVAVSVLEQEYQMWLSQQEPELDMGDLAGLPTLSSCLLRAVSPRGEQRYLAGYGGLTVLRPTTPVEYTGEALKVSDGFSHGRDVGRLTLKAFANIFETYKIEDTRMPFGPAA